MDRLTLGRVPDSLTVAMTAGTFKAMLQCQDSSAAPVDWPDGTTLRLQLQASSFDQSWSFDIDGSIATVVIASPAVAALPESKIKAQLWLDYGDGEFLWCSGEVVRHG